MEKTTSSSDQKSLAVTIYNQNLALIKDLRVIELPRGEVSLAFKEVSAQIQPETALLKAPGLQVIEQNFEFDLLTPQALLEKYVGQEVTIVRVHPTTGEETREAATVLSTNGGVVLRTADHIEMGIPGRLVFPEVPGNLRDRPTLVLQVDSKSDKRQDVELSYLTGGLSWKADYVAELNKDDDRLDINGWVTLTNESGVTYRQALVQLVAGEVNRVQKPMPEMAMLRAGAVADAAPMPEQEALHIARKVASALQFAWEKHHMLHRDIKPANIMLDPRGAPLRYLKIYNAPLKNLDALEGAPLETLILHTLPELTRLGPVTEAPLKRLEVCNTGVDDLSVLKGMELVTLVFEPYNVKRGISVVRNMESIQRIGVFGTPPMEPDEFWKLYDLGGFKEP